MLVLRFSRHRPALISSMIFLVIVLFSVAAPWLAPYDPAYINPTALDDRPSWQNPLGLDQINRDMLSRLLYGGRVSLAVSAVAVVIYMTMGILVGAVAGYFGGWIDSLISRIIDVILSFPSLVLILVLVSMLGPGVGNLMFVLGILGWPPIARIVRGEFVKLRYQDFVLAARTIGVSDQRIILRHILPNTVGPVLVAATFGMATVILQEASLSFLGLGVQPPTASWGQMLSLARSMSILENKLWLWMPPGMLILVSVLCINFIGDGLRDALDPQLKNRT